MRPLGASVCPLVPRGHSPVTPLPSTHETPLSSTPAVILSARNPLPFKYRVPVPPSDSLLFLFSSSEPDSVSLSLNLNLSITAWSRLLICPVGDDFTGWKKKFVWNSMWKWAYFSFDLWVQLTGSKDFYGLSCYFQVFFNTAWCSFCKWWSHLF